MEGSSQFRPGILHSAVHRSIVRGKYAPLDPQVVLESLQCEPELCSFLPHPAILRGLFGWDFGCRGLSIMHFTHQSIVDRMHNATHYDLSDFSKNTLPKITGPASFSAIIDALDSLATVVKALYKPVVSELIATARSFLLSQQQQSYQFVDRIALDAFVFWINERFETFRSWLARGNIIQASRGAHSVFRRPPFIRQPQTK